ncbi:MAG: Nramp family divalent metal transporter [Gemmataceae bacterium]
MTTPEQRTEVSRFRQRLREYLPGIFLLGANIGTGSVTAMAVAGATYGMSLLWAIAVSCLATFFLIEIYGRLTLVTGETALYAFRRHLHPAVGIFMIVGLTVGVLGSVIGVMGIVADVSYEWSKLYIEGGIKPVYWALFYILLVYALFWNGTTLFFEKALAVMVAIMGASFVVNFFVLAPTPGEILRGLIPSLPEVPAGANTGPFLVVASMVGTTVASSMFIIRSTLVKEAGWTVQDLPIQRRDALVSASMMFVMSATIMAAAAGTLHAAGQGLTRAAEMVGLLEPVAGPFAVTLFVFGIVSAGVSSQFPNVLLFPWLMCDYRGSERDMTRWYYRLAVLLISLLGLIVPVFEASPVLVMVASQVFGALMLPVTVTCILIIGNNKSLMGAHAHGAVTNLVLVLLLAFALFVAVLGLRGVFEAFVQ